MAAGSDPPSIAFLAFTTVGAFITWRKPRHPLGWILLADGLVWLAGGAANHLVLTARSQDGSWAFIAAFFDVVGWVLGLALIAFVILLFPSGRLGDKSSRLIARTVVFGGLVMAAAGIVTPGPLPSYPTIGNPLGVKGFASMAVAAALVGTIVFFGGMIASLVQIIARYRRSTGVVLQQLRWLAFAAILMLAGFAAGSALAAFGLPGQPWFNTIPMLTVPLAIGVAVVRYRLWDLDLVVGKTLQYGLVSLAIVLVYVGLVAGFGALVDSDPRASVWLVAVATATVAAVLQPMRLGAKSWAQRLVFPGIHEPKPKAPRILTLGGFRVERDGLPIEIAEWRSRKARTLLKVLVARRGAPLHREQLIEVLWPGEPASNLVNRLAVATSTLRSVLDPIRTYPKDHFVASADDTLRLDLDHVVVDVEVFLKLVASLGDSDRNLAEVLEFYRGDFLVEDIYEEWARPLREEARAAYVSVLVRFAEEELATDRDDGIAAYLRILEVDPWNEGAHLAIVDTMAALGRHGEARRAYLRYLERMAEIGVEPNPMWPDFNSV
jgi:DNA-binding SARP family transcriptional activator/MFS family permease